jgi:hypothetical protein
VEKLNHLLVVLGLFDWNVEAVKLEMGAFADWLLLLVAVRGLERLAVD